MCLGLGFGCGVLSLGFGIGMQKEEFRGLQWLPNPQISQPHRISEAVLGPSNSLDAMLVMCHVLEPIKF